jgi:hypothetical protein
MGSFSIWHWLLVIFVGYGIYFFVAAVSRSRMRGRLFAWAERRVYARRQMPLDEPPPGRIALPYLLGFWTLVIVFGLTLVPTVDLSVLRNPASAVQSSAPGSVVYAIAGNALNLFTVVLVIFGLLVHLRPNHSRQLKYSLIMACIPVLALAFRPANMLDALRQEMYATDANASFFEVALVSSLLFVLWFSLAFWYIIIVVIIAVLGGARIRRHVTNKQIPSGGRFEQLLFTFVRMKYAGPVTILCFWLSKGVMLVLLMTRYVTIERFRRQPIIYLRSFRHDDAAEVFGRAIAPAIAQFGIVKGLVHSHQTSGTLMSRASIWQFGLMATVPDEYWQDWVRKALCSARLVIIDCSVLTGSVMWEINTALQHVNRRGVLIITNDQVPIGTTIDAEILSYGRGPKAMAVLRSDMATWAEGALPGRRSRFIPVATLAWLCVLLVACADFVLTIVGLINLPR